MLRNPTLVPRAILPSVASAGGWSHHPPPSPPAVFARNWTKYNKSLKDPVRGAGSAQVQIRSYRNRQSGNLASKVRNAFPVLMALRPKIQTETSLMLMTSPHSTDASFAKLQLKFARLLSHLGWSLAHKTINKISYKPHPPIDLGNYAQPYCFVVFIKILE